MKRGCFEPGLSDKDPGYTDFRNSSCGEAFAFSAEWEDGKNSVLDCGGVRADIL